jgi:hypothetical protein
VHVNRLRSIARKEEEPVRATPQDRWAQGDIFAGSTRGVTEQTVPTTRRSSATPGSRQNGPGTAVLSR